MRRRPVKTSFSRAQGKEIRPRPRRTASSVRIGRSLHPPADYCVPRILTGKEDATMGSKPALERPVSTRPSKNSLLEHYGCGPIRFAGTESALYHRHLYFDNVIRPLEATARDKFEALARSVRDILSQRWTLTERT